MFAVIIIFLVGGGGGRNIFSFQLHRNISVRPAYRRVWKCIEVQLTNPEDYLVDV